MNKKSIVNTTGLKIIDYGIRLKKNDWVSIPNGKCNTLFDKLCEEAKEQNNNYQLL